MNTQDQMNRAMRYIEDNLLGELDTAQAAMIACCSEYHFRRMFSFLAGMPLGEYIRRRRLTVAAVLLKQGGIKVIDLALQLGYESPDAFAKAFTAMHGISPSAARKPGAVIQSFLPMSFRLTIKGGNEMQYRIVKKEAFTIVGLKKRITMVFEGVNPQMAGLFQQLTPEKIQELKALCDTEPRGIVCVSANFSDRTQEGSELDQYVGVATSQQAPPNWETLRVAATNWAVFTAVGEFPKALQQTWADIYAQWLPCSGYELVSGPEILWNESPDTSKPDYKSEIWIPVKERSIQPKS